jgi:signal transduction histidine kinase
MGWTNLVMLVIGVGIGALGPRWLKPLTRNRAPAKEPISTPCSDQITNQTAELEQFKAKLQQTQAAYQLAREAEQFKAGFLARTSHELRSPLNSIMSLQQLILADLCENAAEEREFTAQSYSAAQKMLGLLDRLISVSKATYGSEQLQLQPVCLEDVLMEVESLTILQAQNRSQQLKITYPDSDLWVIADPRWLRQVLVSLVDTPMRLMQEGEIRLISQPTAERHVEIQITDQRPASAWSEPLDLLQTLSYRSDPSIAKPDIARLTDLNHLPSAGLTLLINQTILELMGGSLEVVATPSAESPETVIRCLLPLANEE